MEENIEQFGLNNIAIIDHVDDESMKDLPVPSLAMLVASASMEQEIACLLRFNAPAASEIYTKNQYGQYLKDVIDGKYIDKLPGHADK